ncbi:MAG: hypothetical protein ACRYE9_05990 [Janthinobacterium lividum]
MTMQEDQGQPVSEEPLEILEHRDDDTADLPGLLSNQDTRASLTSVDEYNAHNLLLSGENAD